MIRRNLTLDDPAINIVWFQLQVALYGATSSPLNPQLEGLANAAVLNRGWTRGWTLPQVDRNPMFVHLSAAKCFRRNLNACNMRAPAGIQNTYSMSVSPQELGDWMSCHRPCTHLDLTSMTQSTVWNRRLPTTVHLWILMLRQLPNLSSLRIIIYAFPIVRPPSGLPSPRHHEIHPLRKPKPPLALLFSETARCNGRCLYTRS